MRETEINKDKILIQTETNKQIAEKIWSKCLLLIKESTGDLVYQTYFEPIKAIDYYNNTLTIVLPNSLKWELIQEHYNSLLKKVLLKTIGTGFKLNYLVDEAVEEEIDEELNFQNIIMEKKDSKKIPAFTRPNIVADPSFPTFLKGELTFDNFVEGRCNQLARVAAFSIAQNPYKNRYNPLFLYGGVGLGKTHIASAIGNYAVENNRARKVRYSTAEQFLNDYVDSIKNGNVNSFSAFYRDVDILIIDDIQNLAGKEATAEFFFNIFNALHTLGKQIVITSDKPPKNLVGLNDRLISRLQWGLSVDILPPDVETRMAILVKKCELFDLAIDHSIIEYIAMNITNNIRELEGCLIKLMASSSITGKDITLELAKEVVRSVATTKKSFASIETIQKIVAEYFEIPDDILKAKTKKQEVVIARQIAMYFCKKLTQATLKTIGLHFGGRDHTTVLHAISSIERQINDNQFHETLNSIQKRIELNS